MKLTLIMAVASNGVVGLKNQLPWNYPQDLKRFRKRTENHVMVMGRKTFEAFPKPLPKRQHYVCSQKFPENPSDGTAVKYFLDPKEAVSQAFEWEKKQGHSETFLIGGAQLADILWNQVERLDLTLIHKEYVGDVYFPKWDKLQPLFQLAMGEETVDASGKVWKRVPPIHAEILEKNSAGFEDFTFFTFERSEKK